MFGSISSRIRPTFYNRGNLAALEKMDIRKMKSSTLSREIRNKITIVLHIW